MSNARPLILILASGEARRMGGTIKQLLIVGRNTVIGRIVKQCNDRDTRPIVVTVHREIRESIGDDADYFVPRESTTVCHTLVSTQELWEDRVIVLLGDVIYTDDAFDKIMACSDPIRVFGDTWEIFALSFSDEHKEKIISTLLEVAELPVVKLRIFYRRFLGMPRKIKEIAGKPPDEKVFFYIHDWTRDIDLPDEYKYAVRELGDTGLV